MVSSRGIYVSLSAPPIAIPADTLDEAVRSAEPTTWRPGDAVYPGITATFQGAVAAPLTAAYRAPHHETKVDSPVLASALIPTEFRNFHFISVGAPGALGSWMVYFEYERGKTYIVAISVDG